MNNVTVNNPIKKQTYEVGDIFALTDKENSVDFEILSQVSDSEGSIFFCLVSLHNGNRWVDGKDNVDELIECATKSGIENDCTLIKLGKGSVITIKID
jgi:hypothetical protein